VSAADDDLAVRLADFESAIARLSAALAQPKTEWTRDASIQRFEFTFELAWKSVALAAQRQGIDVASPRRAWQTAFQLGWIDDDLLWLDMLQDRNRASHSYREATAEKIFARLPGYAAALQSLLERLRTER
jgi:nucleotidyltransferase substrate binding protein (TIGR01987 family)